MAKLVKASFDVEGMEHSERGPSTAHRWRACPGSVRLSRGLPDDAGIEAAYGTVFHDYAADCLELGIEPWGFVGDRMWVNGHGYIEFDGDMARYMMGGLDLLWAMADAPGTLMLVEQKVDLQEWIGLGEFGTTDCAIIDPVNRRLIVFDWKYGAGVPVSPEWNDQAILYALGTWSTFARRAFFEALAEEIGWEAAEHADAQGAPWEDDIEVVVIIEQPRAPGGGGTWTTTMGAILAEGRRIRRDAQRTEEPDAPFSPGTKQCQFCRAAKHNICEARTTFFLDLAQTDFDEIETDFAVGAEPDLPTRRALSPEARSQILLHKDAFSKWLDQLHEEAMEDAKHGRPVPGMKRVAGRRSRRKWRDPKKAEIMLVHDMGEKDAWVRKLRSPTDIEDTVGRKAYEARYKHLVEEGEASPILVPESDKRDPLPDYTSDFDLAADDPGSLV